MTSNDREVTKGTNRKNKSTHPLPRHHSLGCRNAWSGNLLPCGRLCYERAVAPRAYNPKRAAYRAAWNGRSSPEQMPITPCLRDCAARRSPTRVGLLPPLVPRSRNALA